MRWTKIAIAVDLTAAVINASSAINYAKQGATVAVLVFATLSLLCIHWACQAAYKGAV